MTAAPKPLRFSINDVTVGDMEDIEAITGESFEDVIDKLSAGGEGGKLRVPLKVIKAIVFVVKRQADSTFTIEQARNVKFSELELELDGAPADPPAPAG